MELRNVSFAYDTYARDEKQDATVGKAPLQRTRGFNPRRG
jgi:hypothetical protein